MKIRVIQDNNHDVDTITITCHELTPEIENIMQAFNSQSLLVTHRGTEFALEIQDVLFFETEEETVYVHLAHASYQTKYRLYELETALPSSFVRISKSTIVNYAHIASINRGLATTVREITFHNTHKIVYVSRKYYPILKERMEERSL